MRLSDTFVLELVGLRNRAAQGRLYSDPEAPDLDVILAAQPEADRLPMVDALAVWRAERDRAYPFDWCRATWAAWPTLADAQAYAAYLSAKADTNPERGEEARLFAAFVEALPAAWAQGRDA